MNFSHHTFTTTTVFTTRPEAVLNHLLSEKKERNMYSFELLEKDCYYIIQLQPGSPLALLQVKVITDNCMFVINYHETAEMTWVKKTDNIHDIIECLSDDAAQQWLTVYNSSEDASYYEGDEE